MSVFATAGFSVQGAQAQSLQELLQAARQHDATYLAARAQSDATQAKADQASLLPTLSLAANANRSMVDPFPGTPDARLFGQRTTTLNATQPLYRPQLKASVDQAQTYLEQAQIQWTQAEQDLMIRLSQAYFDVLAAQDNLTLVKAQKTANAEQLAAAKRNFEVGTATITDTHEAQARYDLAQAQEIAVENDLSVKRLALSTLCGLAQPQPLPLKEGVLPATPQPADMASWVGQALEKQPAVQLAQISLSQARLEREKAVAAHKPTLDAVVSYGPVHNIGGTATSATTVDTRFKNGSVALNFNLPLYAGGTTQARVRETQALEEQASTLLEAARRNAAQSTRSAWLNELSGRSQVKALEAAALSSKSALEANQLGYQVGVRINIDVLNAQSQLFQTRRDLAKARYDLVMAQLKLKQAAGVLQWQDMDGINLLLNRP